MYSKEIISVGQTNVKIKQSPFVYELNVIFKEINSRGAGRFFALTYTLLGYNLYPFRVYIFAQMGIPENLKKRYD